MVIWHQLMVSDGLWKVIYFLLCISADSSSRSHIWYTRTLKKQFTKHEYIVDESVFLPLCRYNPFLDQGVSRYEFFFHMRRHKRAAFFKIFLPPLFIVLVASFVLFYASCIHKLKHALYCVYHFISKHSPTSCF
jgi:hypothetical protein